MVRRALCLCVIVLASCKADLEIPPAPVSASVVGAVDTDPAQTNVAPGGITVQLIDDDGLKRSTLTDADGGFAHVGVQPGLYALEVTAPTFATLIVPNVRVRSGVPTDVGVLSPTSTRNSPDEGRLTGLVSAPAGASVAGATVQFLLKPNDDLLGQVTVGFDGVFTERLPPGHYVLRASHPDFTSVDSMELELLRGQVQDLRMTPLLLGLNPATLTGTVMREVEGGPAVPADGALVTLGNGATTTTDAQGAFILTGLPAGSFTLRAALAAHFDPSPARMVTLRAGQTTAADPFTVSLVRGTIEGTVELSDRAPIDVVSVSAVSASTMRGYAAVVSPDPLLPYRGTFTINDVPSGSYEVQAAKARYSRATTTVSVTTGSTPAGNLLLALQQGDFLIDDADTTNVSGYTRTRDVTLRFTGFPATGVTSFRVAEDPGFPDAGFAPYTGVQQPYSLSSSGDGLKTVFAQYRDNTGATSPTFQNSIILDQVAPPAPGVTLQSTGTPNGAVRFARTNQVLPLSLVATDDRGLAAMKISGSNSLGTDGTLIGPRLSVQGTTTFARSTSADGAQTVYVQLVDNAGNLSPLGQDTIVVDATAPGVSVSTLAIPRGLRASVDGFTNSPFVDVTVAATPQANGEALYIKLANATGAELDAANFTPVRASFSWIVTPADGLKTVSAVLMDSAGNTSAIASSTITLDTTPPSPVSATLASGLVRGSPVRVNVASTAVDLSPTVGLATSDNPGFPGAAGPLPAGGFVDVPLTTVPSSPGVYPATVYARFRDRAGNDAVISLPLTVDSEPPAGFITLQGALADGTPDSSLTAGAAVSVLAGTVTGASGYVLGDASLTACPNPQTTTYAAMPTTGVLPHTLTGSGSPREVRACFRDAAGNVFGGLVSGAWVPSTTIGFDATPPTGCTLSVSGRKVDGTPAPAGRTASVDVITQLTGCSGALEAVISNGVVTCSNTVTGWAALTGLASPQLPPVDGTKTVSACVRDAARNVASVASVNIVLDTAPPSAASVEIEFLEGVVNRTEASGRSPDGGLFVSAAVRATWADATELVLETSDGRGPLDAGAVFTPLSPGLRSVTSDQGGGSALVQLLDLSSLGASPDAFRLGIGARFRDDVGNATERVDTQVLLDVTRPLPPTLTGLSTGNRSGTLFWLASPSFDVTNYELGTGTSMFVVGGQAPAGARTGTAIGLRNRREYQFAVRAVDGAGNRSLLSNALTGTSGWRAATVPLNSVYPVRPLDVAVKGEDIYLTFSERDVEGSVETGNLRMAHSPDRGRTWQLSTIDASFAWNRKVGRINVQDTQIAVTTIGSDQDPSTTNYPTLGEAKIYSSIDGVSWTKWTDSNLPMQANWGEVGGPGLVVSGTFGRMYYVQNPGAANLIRTYGTTLVSGFNFPLLSTFYDAPDTVQMNDLAVCDGNYLKVMVWKEAGQLNSLTHRFVYDTDYVGTEGNGALVQSGANDSFDLACSSLPGRANAYVVYKQGATIGFRGRQASGTWLGNGGFSVVNDADVRFPPRIHAAGTIAAMVYRPQSGGVRLGVVTDEGSGFSPTDWDRVEANPLQGYWPVVGGEAIDDLAIAYTDSDAATLTVLVPELRGVTGRGLPGINTASLSWSSGGLSDFIVGTDDNASFVTPQQSFYMSQPTFDVAVPADEPLYHRIGARDSFGQGSEEGEIWQMAPFEQTTLFTANFSVGTGATSTAGVVAHDNTVVVLPPYGLKMTTDSDLTLYRSVDQGRNWAALQPPAAVVTSAARSMDGALGRAVLAYRLSASIGVRARLFSSLTGAYPAETMIDATMNADHIAVGTDRNNRFAIVSSSVATDQIGIAWSNDGVTFVNRARLTIPAAASYAITDVSVWRVDPFRLIISWRQSGAGSERIYFAESTDQGVTFGVPVLLVDGTTGGSGNQFVNSQTITRGSGNDAYSILGYVSQNAVTPPRSANLFLAITGTDHPPTTGNFTQFLLDQDPAVKDSFDLTSTSDGHVVAYQTTNLVGSVNEISLKAALCTTDCHLLKNWYRRSLATWPGNSATRLSPVVTQSTTSGGAIGPRWYVTFREAGQLRILRGGLVRRVR
ncbi:MAG: carboxypeptidase-like regulatory domain-containing protein [Archangium sp.]|nr:carboxypeptidase-like regulatory domain-containing protein [Archangium sp.]MDP3571989.1 carboxypeptidase-like regulatory domain-containing protein [Archangium sp.]